MIQIERHWRGLNTLVLTLKGAPVGRIGPTGDHSFICQTFGRIAEIDSLSGPSADSVWQTVIGKLEQTDIASVSASAAPGGRLPPSSGRSSA